MTDVPSQVACFHLGDIFLCNVFRNRSVLRRVQKFFYFGLLNDYCTLLRESEGINLSKMYLSMEYMDYSSRKNYYIKSHFEQLSLFGA